MVDARIILNLTQTFRIRIFVFIKRSLKNTHTANVYKNRRKNNVFFLKSQPIPFIFLIGYVRISPYQSSFPLVFPIFLSVAMVAESHRMTSGKAMRAFDYRPGKDGGGICNKTCIEMSCHLQVAGQDKRDD